jgi:hypothetical protein
MDSMILTGLREVADATIRLAQRQGFVLPSEIREVLTQSHLPEGQWKDVVALARPALRYRQGRYYYQTAVSTRLREEQQHQRAAQRAVRELVRRHRADHAPADRRRQDRADFIQPVTVRLEDRRALAVLSRDLSPTGIRLIGTQSLLGRKIQILIPRADHADPWRFVARILWTCAVGDGLFENGGNFLGMADETEDAPPALVIHADPVR